MVVHFISVIEEEKQIQNPDSNRKLPEHGIVNGGDGE